jgi:hypothetical protein
MRTAAARFQFFLALAALYLALGTPANSTCCGVSKVTWVIVPNLKCRLRLGTATEKIGGGGLVARLAERETGRVSATTGNDMARIAPPPLEKYCGHFLLRTGRMS